MTDPEKTASGGPRTVPLTTVGLQFDEFVGVGGDFRSFYVASTTVKAMRRAVARSEGKLLTLGKPVGWYVRVTPRSALQALEGVDLQKYCPGPESWLAAVGPIVRFPSETDRLVARDSPFIFIVGSGFRVFVLDTLSDLLCLAARDFEDFCHHGLMTVPFLYSPDWFPRQTVHPADVTTALEQAGAGDARQQEGLRQATARFRNRTVSLVTPIRGTPSILLVCHDWDDVCAAWPFRDADRDLLRRARRSVDRNVQDEWYPLGLVGTYVDPFHPREEDFRALLLLLFDAAGTVFYYRLHDGRIHRLARDVRELLRVGLLRAITGCRWSSPSLEEPHIRLDPPIDRDYWFRPRRETFDEAVPGAGRDPRSLEERVTELLRPARYFKAAQADVRADRNAKPVVLRVEDALMTDDYTWRHDVHGDKYLSDRYSDDDDEEGAVGRRHLGDLEGERDAMDRRREKGKRVGYRPATRPVPVIQGLYGGV